MFISGGENIHPAEIEAAALLHPEVQQAAVLAVDHPTWGKRPFLFALPKPDTELSEQSLQAFLAGNLAKMKVPDRIIIVSSWPTTAIGKTDYPALRELVS